MSQEYEESVGERSKRPLSPAEKEICAIEFTASDPDELMSPKNAYQTFLSENGLLKYEPDLESMTRAEVREYLVDVIARLQDAKGDDKDGSFEYGIKEYTDILTEFNSEDGDTVKEE